MSTTEDFSIRSFTPLTGSSNPTIVSRHILIWHNAANARDIGDLQPTPGESIILRDKLTELVPRLGPTDPHLNESVLRISRYCVAGGAASAIPATVLKSVIYSLLSIAMIQRMAGNRDDYGMILAAANVVNSRLIDRLPMREIMFQPLNDLVHHITFSIRNYQPFHVTWLTDRIGTNYMQDVTVEDMANVVVATLTPLTPEDYKAGEEVGL